VSKAILHIKKLIKKYDEKEVLKEVDYSFEDGNIYGIIGRNGAGKTTLFNCISNNLEFNSGEILIEENQQIRKLSFDDVGIVSDNPVLPEFLTGFEFINMFMKYHSNAHSKTIDEYFHLINISQRDQHKIIKSYSFGMKNKIQLLCCLIKNPKIILLDEPLSSFDMIVSHDIKKLLVEMRCEHIILMSTHILQLATDISDKVVFLKNGHLIDSAHDVVASGDFEAYIISELSQEEIQ